MSTKNKRKEKGLTTADFHLSTNRSKEKVNKNESSNEMKMRSTKEESKAVWIAGKLKAQISFKNFQLPRVGKIKEKGLSFDTF